MIANGTQPPAPSWISVAILVMGSPTWILSARCNIPELGEAARLMVYGPLSYLFGRSHQIVGGRGDAFERQATDRIGYGSRFPPVLQWGNFRAGAGAMDAATFLSQVINSLAWPAIVLVLVLTFKVPIAALINRIKSLSWGQLKIDFNDTVRIVSPTGDPVGVLRHEPSATQSLTPLSAEEREASRKKAQARLDEDTRTVGYQRGEIFELPNNGGYAVNWSVQAGVRIGVSAK